MQTNERPLTVSEVAEFLQTTRNYVYKLVFLKRLPCYRPGNGRLYFKREEILDYIYQNKQEASHA